MRCKLAPVNLALGALGPGHHPRIGQEAPPAAPPAEAKAKALEFLGTGAVVLMTVSAATAWVGWSTGKREDGVLSAAGYGVALVGALGVLGSVSTSWTLWKAAQGAK